MRIRGGFEALSHLRVIKDGCGRIYVVEEKRVRKIRVFGCCWRLLCVFLEKKTLKIKYAIVFHGDCSILSVYMLEGE
jgi:hypothetical protein